MVAGLNAGSVYASQWPGVKSGEAMAAQTSGIEAGMQQEAAQNTLNVGNYNASMETLKDVQAIGNAAEGYNAGGVLLQGSPLGQLNQARQLSALSIEQIQQQAGLQAQFQNTAANQTINASRAALLGQDVQYTAGLANADITQENVLPNDVGAILGPFGGAALGGAGKAVGSAIGSAIVGMF